MRVGVPDGGFHGALARAADLTGAESWRCHVVGRLG